MTKIEVGKIYNHTGYPMGSNAGFRKVVYVGKELVIYLDHEGREVSVILEMVTKIWEEVKTKHKQVLYANLYRNGKGTITPGDYKKNKEDVVNASTFSTFIGVGTITLEWEE